MRYKGRIIGDLRLGGGKSNHSVIFGLNPEGPSYQHNAKSPVEIGLSDLYEMVEWSADPVEFVEVTGIQWSQSPEFSTISTPPLSLKKLLPEKSILSDYADYAITQSEAADCYIVGAIFPVVGAILERKVWVPWANAQLFPNLFSILVDPPGNMKSTTIDLSSRNQYCQPCRPRLRVVLSSHGARARNSGIVS